jgi:hypothetical protein
MTNWMFFKGLWVSMKQRQRLDPKGMLRGYRQLGVSMHDEHLSQAARINLKILYS